jgi:hypothetical protein
VHNARLFKLSEESPTGTTSMGHFESLYLPSFAGRVLFVGLDDTPSGIHKLGPKADHIGGQHGYKHDIKAHSHS